MGEARRKVETKGLIEREFESLWAKAVSPGAPAIQREECRKFFFAGAKAYYRLVTTYADAGDEPTDADMVLMASLDDELERFYDDMVGSLPTEGSA